jgi:hypothetical protein
MTVIYVVYNVETTVYVKNKSGEESCRSKGAATRLKNAAMKDPKNKGAEFAVAEYQNFRENIEKFITITNLMNGKEVSIRINTPYYLRVDYESYWAN